MPDTKSTQGSEVLERKVLAARQQAYEEELARLEKEVEFRSKDLLKQWLAGEDEQRQQQLKLADTERANQERSLKSREQEFFRQIEEEERRKEEEYRRRKEEEERRKKDEEERKRKEEEELLAAKKREAEIGHLTPNQIAAMQKARKVLETVDSLIENRNYEEGLIEVSKALSLFPTLPEGIEMREKIRQLIRDAKEAEERQHELEKATAGEKELSPAKKSSPAKFIAIAAILIVVIAAVAIYIQRRNSAVPERISIAVLPWTVRGGDDNTEVLAYGIPLRLAATLHSVPALRVMGYPSSSVLAGKSKDAAKKMAGFGFTDALSGTITLLNGKYSVKVDLTDSSGANLWSQTFEAAPEALSKLNAQISGGLLKALGKTAEGRSADIVSKNETSNADAFTAYLQGEARLRHGSDEDLHSALTLFQDASKQDPNYLEPLVGSASVYLSLIEREGDADNMLSKAEELVQKALYIEAANPAALVARSRIRGIKREYSDALKGFDDALQVEPDLSEAYLHKAQVSIELGKFDDATSALKEALNLDPRNFEILKTAGYLEQLNGQYREAMNYHELVLESGQDSVSYLCGPIADCMLFDPDLTSAFAERVVAALHQQIDQNPNNYEAMYRLGRIDQVTGNSQEWLPILNGLNAKLRSEIGKGGKREPAFNMQLAVTLTRLGNFPEATRFASMAAAREKSDPRIYYRAAQMYSVQMFSLKKDQIDSTKRSMALGNLRKAVSLDFRINELVNGDFFNFRSDAEFKKTIQLPIQ